MPRARKEAERRPVRWTTAAALLFGAVLVAVSVLWSSDAGDAIGDQRQAQAPVGSTPTGVRGPIGMAPVHPAPSASVTASDEAPTAAGPIEDRIHSVVSLPSDPIVLGPPRIGPDPSELARRYADLTVDELVAAWKGVDAHYQAEVEAHFDAMEADGRALEVPMPVYDGPQAGLPGMPITANRYADRIVRCWLSIEDPGRLVELVIDPEERLDLYDLDFERNWPLQQLGLRGGVLPF